MSHNLKSSELGFHQNIQTGCPQKTKELIDASVFESPTNLTQCTPESQNLTRHCFYCSRAPTGVPRVKRGDQGAQLPIFTLAGIVTIMSGQCGQRSKD